MSLTTQELIVKLDSWLRQNGPIIMNVYSQGFLMKRLKSLRKNLG